MDVVNCEMNSWIKWRVNGKVVCSKEIKKFNIIGSLEYCMVVDREI